MVATAKPKDALPVVGTSFHPSATGNVAKTGLGSQETLAAPESVEARLKGILTDTSSSGLMQKAKGEGETFASRRGLLNSAMAGQASQAAVYDKATPIASQDAASSVAFGRADQDFGFNERQNTEQMTHQSQMQSQALAAQASLQDVNLKAQAAMQKAALGQQLTLADKQILAQQQAAQKQFDYSQKLLTKEYAERGTLQNADLAGRVQLQNLSGEQELTRQREQMTGSQNFTREMTVLQNQHQVFLTQAQNEFARVLQRSTGAQSIVSSYSQEFESIVNNPNFDQATRDKLIKDAQTRLNDRLRLQDSLLGFAPPTPAPGTSPPPTTTPETPRPNKDPIITAGDNIRTHIA